MHANTAPVRRPNRTAVTSIRFASKEEKLIAAASAKFQMDRAEIVRRCVEYCAPLFIGGKLNIGDLSEIKTLRPGRAGEATSKPE